MPKRSSVFGDENARLKRLVTRLSLDKDMLRSMIRNDSLISWCAMQRWAVAGGVPGQRAHICADASAKIELPIPQSSRGQRPSWPASRLARQHPRFGYRRLHGCCGVNEIAVNHKKVQRAYREEMGLRVKRNRSCCRRATWRTPVHGDDGGKKFIADENGVTFRLPPISLLRESTRCGCSSSRRIFPPLLS